MLPAADPATSFAGLTAAVSTDGVFQRYAVRLPVSAPEPAVARMVRLQAAAPARPVRLSAHGRALAPEDSDFALAEVWRVELPPEALAADSDYILQVRYEGDCARAYCGEKLIADDFWNGSVWEIGLRRHAGDLRARELTLRFLPLRKDAPLYLPVWPDFREAGEVLHVGQPTLVARREARATFPR